MTWRKAWARNWGEVKYCGGSPYKPEVKTGNNACPFTTLYWNFLDKHEGMLNRNRRTALIAKNVARLSVGERAAIRGHVALTLKNLDSV